MNQATESQWGKRPGYKGPGSFPKEVMGYDREHSEKLSGREFSLHLSDGRVLSYDFIDKNTLNMKSVEGGHGHDVNSVSYRAFEGAPDIFIVSHTYPDNPRLNTSVVLDLNRQQVIVVDGEIPAEGDEDYRVRETRAGGCIGKPSTPGDIVDPPFPTDLVGRRFTVNYGGQYTYEMVYLTKKHIAWHCIRGNAGIADVEEYTVNQLAEDVVCLSWSEHAETLAAVMLMNFSTGEINGNMFGYNPESGEILNMALGSEMIDSSEYGVKLRGLNDTPEEEVLRRNKDVVLRSHLEVWNQAKYELIDELYSDEFACHFICDYESTGKPAMLDLIKGHRQSFPDWTERVVDIIAEGDRVVTRYESTGTHEGDFQDIAPTGRKVKVNEVSIYRMENGRIAEQWGFPDGLSVVQQLTQD